MIIRSTLLTGCFRFVNMTIISLALERYTFCQACIPFWFKKMTKEERREKFLLEHPKYIILPKVKKLRIPKIIVYVPRERENRNCLKCGSCFKANSPAQKYCGRICYKKNRYAHDKFKQQTRWKVWWALKKGKIKKPIHCQNCKQLNKLEGHHNDYSKPLKVLWLCKKCHILADKT